MKTIHNSQIIKQKVLLRVDLNVPIKNGVVIDKTRIFSIQSTVNYLRSQDNKIFLLSHFGRPKGQFNKEHSLQFLCEILADCLQVKEVHFISSIDNFEIIAKQSLMQSGDICLLENIRFYKGEEKNDLHFAKTIAENFDVYVNDAFSVSHRNHASVTGITKYLPSFAGYSFVKEIENLDQLLKNQVKPKTAIIGGSKISSKLLLLHNLIEIFDTVILGGAMANTFLLAQGYNLGRSIVEKDMIVDALKILDKSKELKTKIILPIDLVCSKEINNPLKINLVNIDSIKSEDMALDIGENTVKLINKFLQNSKMILWNGPLGAFEHSPFDRGTNKVAVIIKNIKSSQNILTIAGGGDTIAAIKKSKVENGFTYISTAGGAFLEWLEGKESPGVKALKENNLS